MTRPRYRAPSLACRSDLLTLHISRQCAFFPEYESASIQEKRLASAYLLCKGRRGLKRSGRFAFKIPSNKTLPPYFLLGILYLTRERGYGLDTQRIAGVGSNVATYAFILVKAKQTEPL